MSGGEKEVEIIEERDDIMVSNVHERRKDKDTEGERRNAEISRGTFKISAGEK